RRYCEERFIACRAAAPDGADTGLMTGYYEPLLRGSRTRSARFRFPIYGVPDDLRPDAPYYDRAAIERGDAPLAGKEVAWVDDPLDLFFLHVQGSGRVELD